MNCIQSDVTILLLLITCTLPYLKTNRPECTELDNST